MIIKTAISEDELIQILDLQNKNHFKNVPANLKNKNGFVTVRHDLDLLIKMNESAEQIIATDNGQVVGYALVMLKEFKDSISVLVPMFDSFEKILYEGEKLSELNYYVMGQVCIADNYRGQGIFQSLYQKHKAIYSTQFDLCITEVSSSNPRSMRAHEKVGFKTIKTFKDQTDEWNILCWNW